MPASTARRLARSPSSSPCETPSGTVSLSGTGSNIYTQALAREWGRAGTRGRRSRRSPRPERFELAGATVVRPDIGGLLPVFVLDRYAGLTPRLLQELTDVELDRYLELNAAAVRAHLPADLVFANHVLPAAQSRHGPALASLEECTARSSSIPFAVARAWAPSRAAPQWLDAVNLGSPHIRGACSRMSWATSAGFTRRARGRRRRVCPPAPGRRRCGGC